MRKITILFCLLLIFMAKISAQKTNIFDTLKEYQYLAVFIDKNGDTLTKEKIILQPLGTPWAMQKIQTSYKYLYSPDTTGLKKYKACVPSQQKQIEKFHPWIWTKEETTGGMQNSSGYEVFFHPPRGNQYKYTQFGPFQTIPEGALKKDTTWSGPLRLYPGIPRFKEFKGIYIHTHHVIDQASRDYGGELIENCWKIHSSSTHQIIGTSYLDWYFSEEYGFLELHYVFFDGTKIDVILEKIIRK